MRRCITEVPGFMTKLRAEPGVASRALEFLILTGTRMSEMRFATWAEIEGDVWCIPLERMKTRKPHRVPLSPRVVEILKGLRGQHPQVIFPGSRSNKPIDDNTIARVLHRLAGPLTAHGFRSSLRTWAAEDGGFAPEIAEAALAHAIKSGIERALQAHHVFRSTPQADGKMGGVLRGQGTRGDGRRGGGDARCPPWLAGPNTPMRCCWIGRAGG